MVARPFTVAPLHPGEAGIVRSSFAASLALATPAPGSHRRWEPAATGSAESAGREPEDGPSQPPPPPPRLDLVFGEADLARMSVRAFELGRQAGTDAAANSDAAAMRRALEAIEQSLRQCQSALDGAMAAMRTQALVLVRCATRKLAGAAIAAGGTASIESLVEQCLYQIRSVVDIRVHVAPSFEAEMRAAMESIRQRTRFEGAIDIVADDTLEPGAVRLDWGDGWAGQSPQGIAAAIDRQLDQLLEQALPPGDGNAEDPSTLADSNGPEQS